MLGLGLRRGLNCLESRGMRGGLVMRSGSGGIGGWLVSFSPRMTRIH